MQRPRTRPPPRRCGSSRRATSLRDAATAVEAAVASGEPPGAVLVRVEVGGEPHVESFGVSERGGTHEVGPRTVFRLASVSKVVTGIAAAVAVEQGLLDLDLPVTRYLPALRLRSRFVGHDDAEETERITARHLLSHMAGLPRQARVGNGVRDWEGHVRSIGESWLRFPVGRRMGYSDIGPDLLGRVLEVVSGEAFSAYASRAVLRPLGMDDATFDPAEAAVRERAQGYVAGAPAPISGMVPAGSLHASGRDVGRLLRFVLDGGRVEGRRVLSSASLEEMATIPFPAPGQTEGYALGVRLQRTVWGEAARGHAGSGYGFLTDLWWLPESGAGGALLTSSQDHDLRGRVIWDVLEPARILPATVPRPDPPTDESPPPHDVRGRYYDPIYGALVVEAREGALGLAGPSFRVLRFESSGDAIVDAPPFERLRFVPAADRTPSHVLRVRDGASWSYNDGPADAVGPDDPAWRAYEGRYEADRPVVVERRKGHLYALDRRLTHHDRGLFFTPSGFAVEFEQDGVWFANRFCPRLADEHGETA